MSYFLGPNVMAIIIVLLLLVVLERDVASFTLFPSNRATRPATRGTNHGRRRTTTTTTTTPALSNSAEQRGGGRHWWRVLATSTAAAVIAVSPTGVAAAAASAGAGAVVGAPIPISVPIIIPTRSDYKTSVYDFYHGDCTTDCVLGCRASSSSRSRTLVSHWNTKGVGPPEIDDDEHNACVQNCVRAGRRYCQQETASSTSTTTIPRYVRTTREPIMIPSHNRRHVLLQTEGVVEDE